MRQSARFVGRSVNPYEPSELNPQGREKDQTFRSFRFWPLLLMNLAFGLCAILVVVVPGLGRWAFVSALVVISVGGWALAKSMHQS